MGHWLAKYINKESTFAILISHKHPYKGRSDTLVGTISVFTATYVEMAV